MEGGLEGTKTKEATVDWMQVSQVGSGEVTMKATGAGGTPLRLAET